jgi:hypothetical protein
LSLLIGLPATPDPGEARRVPGVVGPVEIGLGVAGAHAVDDEPVDRLLDRDPARVAIGLFSFDRRERACSTRADSRSEDEQKRSPLTCICRRQQAKVVQVWASASSTVASRPM